MTHDSTIPQVFPGLPIGMSVFEELRRENSVYVDKTMYFHELLKEGKVVFFARPRRFGKSLTVSALDAFCSGRVELFRGLAAERHMRSPDFVARPVVRLDMSMVAGGDSIDALSGKIRHFLGLNAERHNVSLQGANYAIAFSSLLKDVHKSTGKRVVVLIDEYDTPILNLKGPEMEFSSPKLLSETRIVMQNLYSKIKYSESEIETAFITGITKSTLNNWYFGINNFIDISLSEKYKTLTGFTQEELELYFAPFIAATAVKLRMSEQNLLDEIRERYSGFSFDGRQMLYSPFSILTFFREERFKNYSMEADTEIFLRNFMKNSSMTADHFQGRNVSRNLARSLGKIDDTSPQSVFYQSGYLSLRAESGEMESPASEERFSLEYPNLEVRGTVSRLFLETVGLDRRSIDVAADELPKCLASGDISGMAKVLSGLLAGIRYHDRLDLLISLLVRTAKKIIGKITGRDFRAGPVQEQFQNQADKLERSRGESYYRSLLQACLWMAGARVAPELPKNIGQLSLEVFFHDLTYVFGLRMTKNARGAVATVREGMKQIRSVGYVPDSKNPVLVSIAIGRAERNIVGCLFEKDGHESVVKV
ncbi:MAG: AAA family ATPase [Deltaproteobacteria bacterium]|jgi:hypothetical protein|nr:AAA family ATPase [Deltaproteobacteria bacterium]